MAAPQKEEKGVDATVSERLAAEQDAGSYLNQPQCLAFYILLFLCEEGFGLHCFDLRPTYFSRNSNEGESGCCCGKKIRGGSEESKEVNF